MPSQQEAYRQQGRKQQRRAHAYQMMIDAQEILQETDGVEETQEDATEVDQKEGQFFQATPTDAEAGEVVAGMITVASHPARVLFDSGATHSFISSAFLVRYSLESTPMPEEWNINTGNGQIVIS